VTWLRRYGNYLFTPRTGLLSADTLAGIAPWLCNVLRNQAMPVASGLALLCIPWLLFVGLDRSFWLRGGPQCRDGRQEQD
jgi:hypothetical protein